MTIQKDIEIRIIEDWGSDSCPMLLFRRLLKELRPGATRYLPPHYLANLVKDHYGVKQVEDAARYLSGPRIGLFELAFELIEEDNESRDIETAMVLEALRTGILIDPETGERIIDFETKVFMYFRGTDLLEKLVEHARQAERVPRQAMSLQGV
ncbi:hypothetical protein GF339_17105 [candidate division KSB3 bacterium]|uniref:Uncharacterized protein n=1 Tax=candidate division KSB3 bacterium TaxID=2044937 RepID=A0A9D5Q7H5_9BACT|nr:hypothetical protein [candidate division KSB3 bacterium]MBD3326307.1 hypothetical protein [candidate division KSB3 bacterium]